MAVYYDRYDENFTGLTEDDMLKYNIKSISTISEATFTPRLLVKMMDGKQISLSVSRSMIEDLKACYGIKVDLRDIILREIEGVYEREGVKFAKKEIKRVYSDLDPYGEERWEN